MSRKASQTTLQNADMLCLLKNQCVAMGVSYPVHVVYSIYAIIDWRLLTHFTHLRVCDAIFHYSVPCSYKQLSKELSRREFTVVIKSIMYIGRNLINESLVISETGQNFSCDLCVDIGPEWCYYGISTNWKLASLQFNKFFTNRY